MRDYIGASSLLDAQGRDVERLRVLALDHVVGYDRAVPGNQFRGCITECRPAVKGNVVLNNRGLAFFLSHNQIARMSHERLAGSRRNKEEIYRIFQDHALADADVRSILGKSCVQSRESVTPNVEIVAEVRLDVSRISAKLLRKTAYRHSGRKLPDLRKLGSKPSIYEYELTSGTG